MKLPAFQFYPADWRKDPNLRRCSAQARGVWIDVLCLMHECERRGVLATSGAAWTVEETACAVGGNQDVTLACIRELCEKGVLRRSKRTGQMFSARMVRDERLRIREKNRKRSQRCPSLVPPKSHPSSSSSSLESKKKHIRVPIGWTPESGWSGITDADRASWASAYPLVEAVLALAQMDAWLRANPEKRPKASWARFLSGWLSRDQKEGGNKRTAGRGTAASVSNQAPGAH